MLALLTGLLGILFGIGGYALLMYTQERKRQRLLLTPAPQFLHSRSDAPPPKSVPYEYWPPFDGWHRLIILREPHDGDTVLAGFVTPVMIRLAKLNAPELNTAAGKKSRDVLRGKLQVEKMYTAWLYGREKYGRTMAEFFDESGKSINSWLVDSGHAVEWDGKGPRPAESGDPSHHA